MDNIDRNSIGIPLSLGQVLHQLSWDKMLSLMTSMSTNNMDCNFWFIKVIITIFIGAFIFNINV